ncbi:PREDICTED: uncharacterized protein LOC108371644 [Rhagoletis zephyria]|uniref:uncharacterized protein LOC108371644 n=1 Tax=Rhagoletis zephyria TaxID=28612 RepID=UPI0008113D4A|nr:PREDICTED: uncharacterized protein LOC108371644 [Rhagoletis zephyria]
MPANTHHASIISYKLARYSRGTRANEPVFREKQELSYTVRKSLVDCVRDELQQLSRRLFYQRIYILAKNNLNVEPPSRVEEADFKIYLQAELKRILKLFADDSISGDKPTGCFIYMGDYSILVFECVEDIVGGFCAHLSAIADKYFQANKVFLTEDRTAETYFQAFHSRRAAQININEKFPAHTITDIELMGQQHLTIKRKLHDLCEALAEKVQNEQEASIHPATSSLKGTTVAPGRLTLEAEEPLPANIFNRLLPEVQRIELVLACNRFYCSVQRRALMYNRIPVVLDTDLLPWPIPYNYTPVGVFRHSPFDVNLTFSDYGKKDDEKDDVKSSSSEGSEKKGENSPE